jgi:hypothetical protein
METNLNYILNKEHKENKEQKENKENKEQKEQKEQKERDKGFVNNAVLLYKNTMDIVYEPISIQTPVSGLGWSNTNSTLTILTGYK